MPPSPKLAIIKLIIYTKKLAQKTKLHKIKLPIYNIKKLTSPYPIPDMDTSTPGPSKKSMRVDITRKFEARVNETTEKVDPLRAKAKEILGNADGFVLESFDEEVKAPTSAPEPAASVPYLEAPLLTLRELMPGSTGEDTEDGELDLSFRADRIEFIVVQRELTKDEAETDVVLQEVGDVDWDIPTQEEYEDIMGQVVDVFTYTDIKLVQALRWSSVAAATGVGCFPVGTGNRGHIDDIRGVIRTIIYGGRCFESFPKKALMKSFSLTAFFPRSTKFVGMKKLVAWLLLCNRGLRGTIWPSISKKFPDDHPNTRKRGARILSFTGNQQFLDSLYAFPKGYPFSIKIANVYIEGGDRTAEGKSAIRRPKPKMTKEALQALLARHGKEIIDDAEENEDTHANARRESQKQPEKQT